ncbi:MAG: ferrous iron transporter B, partial [Pseudomonadota bacterium]|nr:ferrous iron transporter B [Pseudomonadota bacterium]
VEAAAADVSMSRSVLGMMVHEFGSHASAFAYCVFVLLYFPCISTLAVMRREIGRRWATISMVWTTGFAYVIAVCCYQVLMLGTLGASALVTLGVMLGVLVLAIMSLRYYAGRLSVMEGVC